MEYTNNTPNICSVCKRPLSATDRFCKYCGTKVETSTNDFSYRETIKEESFNHKESEEKQQSIFDKIND